MHESWIFFFRISKFYFILYSEGKPRCDYLHTDIAFAYAWIFRENLLSPGSVKGQSGTCDFYSICIAFAYVCLHSAYGHNIPEERRKKKEEQFLQPKFPILTNFQKSKKRAIFYQISKINPLSCSGDSAFSFETIKSEKFLTGKKVVGLWKMTIFREST